MPVIYRLTSPSGKSYVGQTTQPFDKRWTQHTKLSDTHCRALKSALRKYGAATFQKEILLECGVHDLDYFEVRMIEAYDTLSPNGYNLDKGRSARRNFTDTTKKLMRASAKNASRFSEQNLLLPDYITVVSDNDIIIGYRIAHHPDCKDIYFKTPGKSSDENLEDAVAYLKKINLGGIPRKRTLPKYLHLGKMGYYIKYKSKHGTFINRKFQNQSIPLGDRLIQAKQVLKELIETDI